LAKQKLALLFFFRQTNLEEFEIGQTEPAPAQPVPTKRLSDRQLLEEILSKLNIMIQSGVRARPKEHKTKVKKEIIAGYPPSTGPKREPTDHAIEFKKLLQLNKADRWAILKKQAEESSKCWKKPLGNVPS